jgi:hypothetical protein
MLKLIIMIIMQLVSLGVLIFGDQMRVKNALVNSVSELNLLNLLIYYIYLNTYRH